MTGTLFCLACFKAGDGIQRISCWKLRLIKEDSVNFCFKCFLQTCST